MATQDPDPLSPAVVIPANALVVLVTDVPLEMCLAQNLQRSRRVAPEVIEMHYRQYEEAMAALPAEGYHAVHRVGPETRVGVGPAVRPGE